MGMAYWGQGTHRLEMLGHRRNNRLLLIGVVWEACIVRGMHERYEHVLDKVDIGSHIDD